MILIIIIIIKITSPTDASSQFHFTEVKILKKKVKRKRFVSALRAEQRVGLHRDGRAGGPGVEK